MKTILMLLVVSISASAHAATERAVSVSGSCTRDAVPDRGEIIVTAEHTALDLREAAKKATESYERVREGVKKLKLADFETATSEYLVTEVREWERNKNVSKGFRVRMGLRVQSSEIQRLGEVIALAAKEGLRDVGNLRIFLSDAKERAERFACLQAAAEDARAKAEKLATSLGASIGEVIELQEGGENNPPPPRPMMAMEMRAKSMSADMAAPAVEPGQQRVSATVHAVFRLK